MSFVRGTQTITNCGLLILQRLSINWLQGNVERYPKLQWLLWQKVRAEEAKETKKAENTEGVKKGKEGRGKGEKEGRGVEERRGRPFVEMNGMFNVFIQNFDDW